MKKPAKKTMVAIILVILIAVAVSCVAAGPARASTDDPCEAEPTTPYIAQVVHYEEIIPVTPVETTMEYGPAYYIGPLEEELRVVRAEVSDLQWELSRSDSKISRQQSTIQRLRDKLRGR